MRNRRLQNGQVGEIAAERYFADNGWKMIRSQPAIEILGSKPGKLYGRIFTVRMVSRGGVPDYTGYAGEEAYRYETSDKAFIRLLPLYRAVEVKEASGDSMPASRLDKAQREFMAKLPDGSAWVGVFWTDTQKFEIFPFVEKGSYKRCET